MRLNAKWNRRGFLGSVGALTGLLVAPRKAFLGHQIRGEGVRIFGQSI